MSHLPLPLSVSLLALALASCGDDGGQTVQPDGALGDASPDSPDAELPLGMPGAPLGSYQMTYYWLASEGDHTGPKVEALYRSDCTTVATVSSSFADALRLEGSGRLADGRVLNYESVCGCASSPCFFELDASAPWGLGVQSRPLVPFRSIAVDTDEFSIGQALYVLELDGLMMPGDSEVGEYRHDGCVLATDVGSGIGSGHFDFFAGLREYYTTLDSLVGQANVTLHEGGERCPSE